MRERGYVLPGKQHNRSGSYQFHVSGADAIPRGVHVIFNPAFDESYVEIEVWDFYTRWRWDPEPAIEPTDKDLQATSEIHAWLLAYFESRDNPLPLRHQINAPGGL